MLPAAADRPKLRSVLDQLASAVEELLLSGLTTASEATRQTINVAMQEAARFRLLRLGSALRVAMEELGRFTKHDAAFSRRRLSFFLNRSWLIGRGLSHALQTNDEKEYDRLNWSPPTVAAPIIEAVCLGAVKKVATGAFVAFDFRLRAIRESAPIKLGQKLTWSAVFPIKAGMDIPAEGFLHLPQKQKFTPNLFLEKKTISFQNAAVSADESAGRITLNDQSKVTLGADFTQWQQYLEWSPAPAIERLAAHKPGPLDLDTELQEEVVLLDYQIGKAEEGDELGQTIYPVSAGPLQLHAIVGAAAEGKALKKGLDDLRKLKKERPPLYGLMHYERCRLVFQPLTSFGKDGPDYLTISKESINKAALLKAMSFT
jgi:hypothetical protein